MSQTTESSEAPGAWISPGLVDALARSRSVVVLTGAGVSAESGIPTFRDALTGMWSKYDATALASPEGFARDPELVTRWYDQRRLDCLGCEPNAGHRALVGLASLVTADGGRFTLVTQNVDRLHQRGGSAEVIELHGSLFSWRCTVCGDEREEMGGEALGSYPPRCGRCGERRRPGVVWFGEMLPLGAFASAQRAASSCDVFLAVGTSGMVEPAASLLHVASAGGARTCEINVNATASSQYVDDSIMGRSGVVLPALVDAVKQGKAKA